MTVGETSVGSFAHCGVRGRMALTRDGGWERDVSLSLRWKGELSFTTVDGSTTMLLVILVFNYCTCFMVVHQSTGECPSLTTVGGGM